MPQYKVNYFDARGRAELIRLIFVEAGKEFVDNRFKREQWLKEKEDTRRFPLGQSPTVEIDDLVLPDSIPTSRYLAAEFGLNGKTKVEHLWCDIVVDLFVEIRTESWKFTPFLRKEKDDAKFEELKKEMYEGTIAKKLGHLEGILKANNGGSGFFVGDGVTWADLALIDVGSLMLKQYPTCFDKTPLVKALYDRVIALPRIKKHIETRPESGI